MKTIRLGKTGLNVSRVGIGGIPIKRLPMDEVVRVIKRYLDVETNFIDTSVGYKKSEESIGRVIVGRREHTIISTKTWVADHARVQSSCLNYRKNYRDSSTF